MNNRRKVPATESKLENAISYLLLTGVIISVVLEIAGLSVYLSEHRNLMISPENSIYIQGRDFFNFLYRFWNEYSGDTAVLLMVTGVIVLILTPFARIILSVVYFGWEKNWKYVLITVFVLVVITVSLTFH